MKKPVLLFVFCTAAIAVLSILSLLFGTADLSTETVITAIFDYDPTNAAHTIIRDLRMPRIIGDIAVGAAFAVSGAVMQGMTRNPLADAGILGINSGAVFAVSLCLAFASAASQGLIILCSFGGAALSTFIVYGLTGWKHGKQSPVRLALAGTAVTAFFSALSQAVALRYQIGQEVTYWTAGGVAGIRGNHLIWAIPFIIAALAGVMVLARALSILSVGEEAAKGLGINIGVTKLAGMLMVLILAGAAVSLAGPIAFIGLIIPHIVRYFTGTNYQKILPCSMVMGSCSMLLADLVSRTINPPNETPIGLVFAVLGVPFFLYLTRSGRGNFDG